MQRSFPHRMLAAAVALSLAGVAARVHAQGGGGDTAKLAAAKALYQEATKAMDAKDYAAACPKLEHVVELVPEGIGGRLTLAECYEAAGKLASAYASYSLVQTMATVAKQPERGREAHDRAGALKPKLATLTIEVADGVRSLAGLEIQRDGVAVGSVRWGVAIPVDKGQHKIRATADGKRTWETTIDVSADGVRKTVMIDAMVDANTGTGAPAVPSQPKAAVQRDARQAAAKSLSHRGQFGAVLRADIAGQRPGGVVPAFGLSYGIGDYVEVAACALVGRSKGVEPGVTMFFLRGALKPRLSVALPIFFVTGVKPGLRLGAGLSWDPIRHFGVFVEASVAAFPFVPEGYDRFVFVPSVGVQPRL